jgi:hypothetical protein
MGTRLPWLPETDDSCITDIDQAAAGVFGEDSGDYGRCRPDALPNDVDVGLEMAAAPKPPVSLPEYRYADARGEQVDDTGEEMF